MNKFRTWGLKACLLAGVASAAFAAHAQSEGPDVLVRKTSEEVLSIIRSDKEIQKGNTARIAQLIEDKVAPHFDFPRMTRLAVGRAWREATDEQKAALTGEFRTLLVRSYAAAFTAYTGIAMDYRPFRMNPGDREAIVQTLIKLPGGAQPVAVDYDMEDTPDGWKVYDVRVAGASLIINYRNLFAQEIQNGGLDGLLKSLVEKNKARPVAARQ
ncbi:MAG TPA: ABC transporter substrate-binding protein [Burkholderiales bacterium]|jgi:phospholipid transport system substrate-binding protein|nr:ABC transporter substrate-binding protein [Burkholderiales bacterium]